jgi:hypothetical protein
MFTLSAFHHPRRPSSNTFKVQGVFSGLVFFAGIGKKTQVVLWTDLPGSFDDVPKHDFLNAAVNHVQRLPPEGKAMAAEYVWRAPNFVVTPLRESLQAEPWFQTNNQLPSVKT